MYDVADLYKVALTVPVAFRTVAESTGMDRLESRVRQNCRQAFKQARLMEKILPDIDTLLGITADMADARETDPADDARPEAWWGTDNATPTVEGTQPSADTEDTQDTSAMGDTVDADTGQNSHIPTHPEEQAPS